LEDKVGSRIEEDVQGYEKAIDVFEKHVERFPANTDSVLLVQPSQRPFLYQRGKKENTSMSKPLPRAEDL
jgi:hypothetical protein